MVSKAGAKRERIVKSKIQSGIVVLVLLAVGGSCRNGATDPVPGDSAYFPLQTGDRWVYQVTQETYSSSGNPATTQYQLQAKISGSYRQNGQDFYILEESTRRAGQSDWQLNSLRTVYKNRSEVVSLEKNVPYVNLTFPIATGNAWNANLYNANPETPLRYQHAGRAFAVGARRFNGTVSVVGANDSTLVSLAKNRRVYAPNVGLVYREEAVLIYCQSSPACIGKGLIEGGNSLKWELVESNYLP